MIRSTTVARPALLQDTSAAGPLFMLAAAFLFTCLNVIIKHMPAQYTVWHIGFYRFCGGMLLTAAILGYRANPYAGRNIRLLILRGIVGSLGFVCMVTAVRLLPLSTAVVVFFSFPAFAAVYAVFIHGERIGRVQIGCIVAMLTGVAVVFDVDLAGGLGGQLIALLGAALAGLTVTLIRALRQHNGSAVIFLYLATMGTIITAPAFFARPVFPQTPTEYAMVTAVVLLSVSGQLLMNQGFFYCKGWEGGVFMSSEAIFAAVAGILVMGDPVTLRFVVGG